MEVNWLLFRTATNGKLLQIRLGMMEFFFLVVKSSTRVSLAESSPFRRKLRSKMDTEPWNSQNVNIWYILFVFPKTTQFVSTYWLLYVIESGLQTQLLHWSAINTFILISLWIIYKLIKQSPHMVFCYFLIYCFSLFQILTKENKKKRPRTTSLDLLASYDKPVFLCKCK